MSLFELQNVPFTLDMDQKLNSKLLRPPSVYYSTPTEYKPYDAFLCFGCHRLHNTDKSWQRHWRGVAPQPERGEKGHKGCAEQFCDDIEDSDDGEINFLDKKGPHWLLPSQVGQPTASG